MTTRPALEPTVGPAGPPPPDFDAALRRLDASGRQIGERLGERLRRTFEHNDLGREELMAAQRDVRRLRRTNLLPGPNEYWEDIAVPRASILVDDATDALQDEADQLGEAIDRFLVATSRSFLTPWTAGADGQAAIQSAGARAVELLVDAVPSSDSIDRLGEWWQRRLHRAALVRSLPRLVVTSDAADLVIGATELALLDGPPWSHGDRLLSAFELAHGEIRNRARTLSDGLRARVLARGPGVPVGQIPGGPVTIELRTPALG